MFHPHSNFKDAKDWVLIAETGELHAWPWHYDASHFKLLKNGNILHNHPSPKTYSEVLRQGEDANNFFEEEEKNDIQKGEQREIRIGERKEYGRIGSDLSNFSPRKRKYRRKKYKNSKSRKKRTALLNKKHRTAKIFKKMHAELIRGGNPPKLESCGFCGTTSDERNMIMEPFYHRKCDFCDVLFEKYCDKGWTLCEFCSGGVCMGFCSICEGNLGKWSPYWRELFYMVE
mgnify:CR=1 FL=1